MECGGEPVGQTAPLWAVKGGRLMAWCVPVWLSDLSLLGKSPREGAVQGFPAPRFAGKHSVRERCCLLVPRGAGDEDQAVQERIALGTWGHTPTLRVL